MPREGVVNKRPHNEKDAEGSAAKKIKQPDGSLDTADKIVTKRDDTFWYSDGNVVVRVGNTVFKLHRSRLERNCKYFKKLFDSGTRVYEWMDNCPVYKVPAKVAPEGFKAVLWGIEMPLENLKSKLTPNMTISLLEAASILSCNAAVRIAKARLYQLWNSRQVPLQLQPGDIRSYASTIATIHLTCEHNIFSILKRVFYELLSNEEFWHIYDTSRDCIDLSSRDRERLLYARNVLGKLWREFILTPPKAAKALSAVNRPSDIFKRCCHGEILRKDLWRLLIVEKNDLKSGALDPLRYNVVNLRRKELQDRGWCEECLDNKESAWKEKTAEWWNLLDDLLEL